MNGVTSGTRLERLCSLRDRIAYEIKVERAAQATHAPIEKPRRPIGRVRRVVTPLSREDGQKVLIDLSVTQREVRLWARAQGFSVGVRGALPTQVIEDYAAARKARK